MCGIVGIYNYLTSEPVKRELLEKMTDTLAHRGPDSRGFYYYDKCGIGFGHRRLSIIDLTTGNQPLCSANGSVWITYNGELYNYPDLKEKLKQYGYTFKTNSDTETLIYAYMHYGVDFFKHLNGIFAFGLWNEAERILLLARDYFGVKPVYFFDSGKTLIFASEIKSLLVYPDYQREIDIEAIDLHMTFRHTPSPKTLFKNICKLPAGSFLTASSRGVGQVRYYWNDAGAIDYSKTINQWTLDLNDSIEKAVRRQMISDVPISLSLSGGIDSNLLLAIMNKQTKFGVDCFTVGFEDNPRYDEIKLAQESCDYFNGHLQTKILGSNDYENMFNKYMLDIEEPVGNESAFAYYFVAKLAHDNGIKVLINGQGADELFGGYHRHIGERYRSIMSFVPYSIAVRLSQIVTNERLKRSLYTLRESNELDRFFLIYSIFLPEEKAKIYNVDLIKNIDMNAGKAYLKTFFERFTNHSALDKMLYIDLRFSLPDNLLLAEDKMAMATSVEARVPFLDIEFVKLVESIPAGFKIKNFQFKHIHKKYAAKWLPDKILRRKKIGFTSPMSQWLTGKLDRYFHGLINHKNSFTKKYLNTDAVKEMHNLHRSGKRDFKRNLFLLLSIEQWHKAFFV